MPQPIKTIFLDFGAAYGNLGEEALLLNAIERINRYCNQPVILLGARRDAELPQLPENVIVTDTPRKYFVWVGRFVRAAFMAIRSMPIIGRSLRNERLEFDEKIWHTANSIIGLAPAKLIFNSAVKPRKHSVNRVDALYSVGAGAINDFNLIEISYKAWLAQLITGLGGKTILSSQGIGPLALPLSRELTKKLCDSMSFITLRDHSYSKSLLTEMGVDAGKMCVTQDEAFSLGSAPIHDAREHLQAHNIAPDDDYLVFHYRESNCEGRTTDTYQILAENLDCLAEELQKPIVFLPMSYGEHSTIDRQAGLSIKSKMNHKQRLVVLETLHDVRLAKAIVGAALCAIGLSYHVHIFALAQNRPSVMIYLGQYYKYKLDGLAGFYPASAVRVLDAAQLDRKTISDAVTQVTAHSHDTLRELAAANESIKQRNDAHLEVLASTPQQLSLTHQEMA